MQLARVVGSVVSTQKSPTLIGKNYCWCAVSPVMARCLQTATRRMKWRSTLLAQVKVNWCYCPVVPVPGAFLPNRMMPSTWRLSPSSMNALTD